MGTSSCPRSHRSRYSHRSRNNDCPAADGNRDTIACDYFYKRSLRDAPDMDADSISYRDASADKDADGHRYTDNHSHAGAD